ncbi:hypothetical protein [Desulfospira joergensenii]|uniref:hypothetical protein n=1 Tax=Desulfospira joergensenii TaxID=53329 RepID=UPI0003B6ED62|nr:hypothetical protein [Desulfospira joergensenii]
MSEGYFSDGLSVADTLLLDDLGGGNAMQTTLELIPPEQTCGLILQIPTPLGSSDMEERVFHSATLWARQHGIVSIGYELLPLDIKWTLSPSLPDGVITRCPESRAHMKNHLGHNHIWQIPLYEAAIFSPVATGFHLNGVKASYHYRNQLSIPADRTVLYLPHNVAMIYEYKKLLQTLVPFGKRLHLMFSVGKDQVRGSYTHKQTIELIYEEDLKQIASYSFHDLNNPWEMMMADAVVACSACISTLVGEKELSCIIFDPELPEASRGNKKRVRCSKKLLDMIEALIDSHKQKIELADIMMLLARTGKTNA